MSLPEQTKPISHLKTDESLALLQILEIGKKQVGEGETMPLEQAICKVRKSIASAKPKKSSARH